MELLNYCTAVKFESFEAAESKCYNILHTHACVHTYTRILFVTEFVKYVSCTYQNLMMLYVLKIIKRPELVGIL